MVAYLYANFVAKRLRSLYGEDGEERFFHHCLCPIFASPHVPIIAYYVSNL